jgi:hypothetical protein
MQEALNLKKRLPARQDQLRKQFLERLPYAAADQQLAQLPNLVSRYIEQCADRLCADNLQKLNGHFLSPSDSKNL